MKRTEKTNQSKEVTTSKTVSQEYLILNIFGVWCSMYKGSVLSSKRKYYQWLLHEEMSKGYFITFGVCNEGIGELRLKNDVI